ncbi:cyclin-D1-binding protein 1 homolog [Glandiceps talaboti]
MATLVTSIASVDEALRMFIANIQLVVDELREGESHREPSVDFKLSEFWGKLENTLKVISSEATKLCLMMSKPPLPSPQDCQAMLQKVEMALLTLLSVYYGLPKQQGQFLRKYTKVAVINAVESTQTLAKSLTTPVADNPRGHLQSTGAVWQCCDSFHTLPKNNKEAVLHVMNTATTLVRDVMEELQEAQESGMLEDCFEGLDIGEDEESNNEDSWSEKDKELILPCLGLAKTCKACLKKISAAVKNKGECKHVEQIADLDDIGDFVEQISPQLDEVVSVLYPPIRYKHVTANAEKLGTVLRNLLERVKSSHMCSEEDSPWLTFLCNAVDHNVDKVRNLTKKFSDDDDAT